MAKSDKLFVVIDPTLQKHVALERAINIAKSASNTPHIVIFISVDATRVDDKPSNKNLYRDSDSAGINQKDGGALAGWC